MIAWGLHWRLISFDFNALNFEKENSFNNFPASAFVYIVLFSFIHIAFIFVSINCGESRIKGL